MGKRYVLAIDQGTTGTTVLLIDQEGQVYSKAYKEITQYYPKTGWVEHDPEEIWEKTLLAIHIAINSKKISKSQIAAIGITNQRETTIVWDKRSGKPFYNAIVWQCRRTSDICDRLKSLGLSEKFRDKTGLVIDPYFSATKLAWILENVISAKENSNMLFGTVDTWLLWKLTNGKIHRTDYTNASRTMLFNIHSLSWDHELLDELKIPATMLPQVCPSSGDFGEVNFGDDLLDGIPIAGIAGDQQAALFGQGCFKPGMVKNTYGTGCFLILNTGEKPINSDNGLLTTLACGLNGSPTYALEGSVFIAGAAIQWLRDGLKIINNASETESLATSVSDAGGVYMVPAFTGLGAPYWDANARGAILGITRGTKKEHIVRAALESVAYQTADVMNAMEKDSGEKIKQLRVDGGATANNFLMQFQSDILGIEVNRPVINETTALGAAFLAGLAVGFWKSESELENCRQIDTIFKPNAKPEEREKLIARWREAVNRVLS